MRHKEVGHIRSLETGAIPVIEQKERQGDNMRFFDRLLKKRKEERSLMCEVCGRSFAHAEEWKCEKPYVCPDCRQLQELQTCDASIVAIDRKASYMEKTLTVLFYSDSIGYFCIGQSSGAYSGLGLFYKILPKDVANPRIEDYADEFADFVCIPNVWFSKDFAEELCERKRMKCDEQIKDVHTNETAEELPQVLRGMDFRIVIKKGCALKDGTLLEYFLLSKVGDTAKIHWSVGFGYSWGAHNPGVGGADTIPAELFVHHDLSAFAAYLSEKYRDWITYDDVYFNSEIKTLFELLEE